MKTIKFTVFAMLVFILVSCQSANPTNTQPTLPPDVLAEYDALKLVIEQDGMHRLPLEEIGWDESITGNIAITHQGEPVPYWVEKEPQGKSSLIFYGKQTESIYTAENVYIIQQNAALTKSIRAISLGTGNAATDYVFSTVHREENLIYAPKVENGDSWHWSKIISPNSQDFKIDITSPVQEPATLIISLWGETSAPVSPNHHVRVSVNQQVVGEAAWDGQTWHLFEAELPAGLLVDGSNTINIHATGEIEARIDIFHLDWLEIKVPKKVENLENQEIFSLSEETVQFSGFEEDRTIFEISTPFEVSRLVLPLEREDSLVLQGNPAFQYISVDPDSYLVPQRIAPVVTEPSLRENPGAAYIAIGHPSLLEPLEPLLEARAQQGLSSLQIPTDAVYDQFNGGLAEPDAIQQFLKFALENWQTPPQYILLVGDASYDFRGYQSPTEENFLPTFLVPTVFGGETGSDVVIAQVNEDEWPDLAIGRVPARSVQQVEAFVRKTLDFEQRIASDNFDANILAIADGQEVTFKNDAEHFIEQFPDAYPTQLIAPEAGAEGTNQIITDKIETGQLLTAYFGHGSVNMWGKDSLFTTEDSAALKNANHLPIVLNFTCLTGLFTHPTEESLAESLLFNPEGGAVAVLAPTSPTLPGDQSFLSNAFIEDLLAKPTARLGDITLFAWRAVPTFADSAVDVMQTFLLFGDPALQLPTP